MTDKIRIRVKAPSISVSASTPRRESGGLTTASVVPPMVETAAINSVSVDAIPQNDGLLRSSPPFKREPVTNSDIAIPGFLRRDPDNLAEWMRKS